MSMPQHVVLAYICIVKDSTGAAKLTDKAAPGSLKKTIIRQGWRPVYLPLQGSFYYNLPTSLGDIKQEDAI